MGDVITVLYSASWQQQVFIQPPRSLHTRRKQGRAAFLIRAFCPNRNQLSTFSAQDRWGETAARQHKTSEHTHTCKNTSRLFRWHRLHLLWNKFSAARKRLCGDAVRERVNAMEQIIEDWRTSCFCYIPLLRGNHWLVLCVREENLYPLELFHVAEAMLHKLGPSPLSPVGRLSKEAERSSLLPPAKAIFRPTQTYKSPLALTQLSHPRLCCALKSKCSSSSPSLSLLTLKILSLAQNSGKF